MYKRLAIYVSIAVCLLGRSPVFAEDPPEMNMVCTEPQHAVKGAAALRSLMWLDGRAIAVTSELREKKLCWFEGVIIPKKYTALARLFLQEGYTAAFAVIAVDIKGVTRYVVVYENGVPDIDT